MNLLEKKCFVAATGLHGLLVLILIVGPAFRNQPKTETVNVVTLIPAEIIDGPTTGGSQSGTPTPPQPVSAPPAVATAPPEAKPLPKPVEPQPQVVEAPKPKPPEPVKVKEPEPPDDPEPTPKVAPNPTPRPVIPKAHPNTKPKVHNPPVVKHQSDIAVDISAPTDSREKAKARAEAADRAAKAEARAEAKARQAKANQLAKELGLATEGVIGSIGENTSHAGSLVQLGSGGGGPVFANYRDIIFTLYYNAWTPPDNVNNQHAKTDVRIVVARDGRITSSEIVRRSGESSLDRSVERALKKVNNLPPFPASATDAQRTFTITFDLAAKQGN